MALINVPTADQLGAAAQSAGLAIEADAIARLHVELATILAAEQADLAPFVAALPQVIEQLKAFNASAAAFVALVSSVRGVQLVFAPPAQATQG